MVRLAAVSVVLLVSRTTLAAGGLQINIGGEAFNGGAAVKMLALLTALSLAPFLLLTATSFVRIIIVFSFLRSALGTQGAPPRQVMIGLALFLTIAIMAPTAKQLYGAGVAPYMAGRISAVQALHRSSEPLRRFMLAQTRESDLALFLDMARARRPASPNDVGMHVVIPAFVISELRTAFEMGFSLFAPFLVVDLVVASVLMAMGMVMLPPALVSLPIKLMLFVLVDGWNLIAGALVKSFA